MANGYVDIPQIGGSSGGGGGGGVTSVGLALPVSVFTVSGTPVTTSGTLTGVFATQAVNTFFASSGAGGSVVPSFRTIQGLDIPAINLATSGNGGVTGTLPGANITPINLATSGNGGVTGTLLIASMPVTNLASSGNGGVTGTLPNANVGPINLANSGNGGVTGTLPIGNGGTGQVTANAAFNALSPMSGLGDMIYGGTAGAGTALPGNAGIGKNYLSQTGTGIASQAPAWGFILSADVPSINLAASSSSVPGTGGGVTGNLISANLTPINLASTGNGGVTGTLLRASSPVTNLATSGNNGVTGTLPSANLAPINLATSGNGGVTGSLLIASMPVTNLASSGNGGVTGTLPTLNLPIYNSKVTTIIGNGNGSASTKIRRFGFVLENTGGDITYADSATSGASFTINNPGCYGITYSDVNTGGSASIGVSLNSTALTTSIVTLAASSATAISVLAISQTVSASVGQVDAVRYCNANDIIRPHTDGTVNDANGYDMFRIIRIY